MTRARPIGADRPAEAIETSTMLTQCGKCRWKIYKKIKTNKYGTYKYRARVPMKGLWKYRVVVPRSGGYAKTLSKPQGVWLG